MLSHILYGQSSLTHGGLVFKARAAGFRGQQVSLTIQEGDALDVAVNFSALNIFEVLGTGAGDIVVTIAIDTTEDDVIEALKADAFFKVLATVELDDEADSTDLVETLAKVQFPAPTDGLQQHLEARLGITNWESRTLVAAGAPVGDIWTTEATLERAHLDGSPDHWEGMVLVGIGFQHDKRYQVQNALLDAFRRMLIQAICEFDHDDLSDTTEITCGYTNTMKDEAAGKETDRGNLNVIAQIKMRWQEPSLDEDNGVPFVSANIGLWREPIDTSVSEIGDGEVFDQTLTITPE